jgi:hypothetical protein
MGCKITRVDGSGRPNIVASLEVSKQIAIPEKIAHGKSRDLLADFIRAMGGAVLQRTQQANGQCIYELSVLRSDRIPDGAQLKKILSKMLDVYERCMDASFFEIDQARPNATSTAMTYCLENRNLFTRRLVDAIKGWVSEELRIKQSTLKECYDDESLVGPRPLTRKESRELQNTIETRQQYLKLIELFEQREYDRALELAKEFKFF